MAVFLKSKSRSRFPEVAKEKEEEKERARQDKPQAGRQGDTTHALIGTHATP